MLTCLQLMSLETVVYKIGRCVAVDASMKSSALMQYQGGACGL